MSVWWWSGGGCWPRCRRRRNHRRSFCSVAAPKAPESIGVCVCRVCSLVVVVAGAGVEWENDDDDDDDATTTTQPQRTNERGRVFAASATQRMRRVFARRKTVLIDARPFEFCMRTTHKVINDRAVYCCAVWCGESGWDVLAAAPFEWDRAVRAVRGFNRASAPHCGANRTRPR